MRPRNPTKTFSVETGPAQFFKLDSDCDLSPLRATLPPGAALLDARNHPVASEPSALAPRVVTSQPLSLTATRPAAVPTTLRPLAGRIKALLTGRIRPQIGPY
jgi:hypothetical protein